MRERSRAAELVASPRRETARILAVTILSATAVLGLGFLAPGIPVSAVEPVPVTDTYADTFGEAQDVSDTQVAANRLVLELGPELEEDDPGWDCQTMGNMSCD